MQQDIVFINLFPFYLLHGYYIMITLRSTSRLTTSFLFLNILVLIFFAFTLSARENPFPVIEDYPLPKSLSLCGEPVPLDNPYALEMLDREFTISVWDRAQVFMWLKRAGRYFPYIEKALAEADMPDDIKYLAVAESALITTIRSNKNAIGLWQFMSHTGKRNGLRKNSRMDERKDFERATLAAIKYLKHLKSKFGSWTIALAAYNCGESCLKRAIREQKVEDYYRLNLPLETERFIFRIAAIKIIMNDPERYGYRLAPDRAYRPIDCDAVRVKVRYRLNITDVAQALGTDYKTIKELNPQILGPSLPTGSYRIMLPSGLGSKMPAVLKQLTPSASRRMKKVSGDYYLVQPGDTLSEISRRTGVPVATLKRLNGISGSLIMVGQELRLTP